MPPITLRPPINMVPNMAEEGLVDNSITKTLQQRYTTTSKRDYLRLLASLVDKYETEEAALVHAALVQKCRAGDIEAIRLYRELQQESSGGEAEVTIVDSI